MKFFFYCVRGAVVESPQESKTPKSQTLGGSPSGVLGFVDYFFSLNSASRTLPPSPLSSSFLSCLSAEAPGAEADGFC